MKRFIFFARNFYFQNFRNHPDQLNKIVKYPLLIGGLASSFIYLYLNRRLDTIHSMGYFYKPLQFIEKMNTSIFTLIKENKLETQNIPQINLSETNSDRYMIELSIWSKKEDTTKIFDSIFKTFNQNKENFQGKVLKNKRIDFDNGQAYILSYSLQHPQKVLHGSVSIYYDLKELEPVKNRIVFDNEEEFSEVEEKMIINVLRNFLRLNDENHPTTSQFKQNYFENEEDYIPKQKKSHNSEDVEEKNKKPSWAHKLEKSGCKVFLPQAEGDQLDWVILI